MEKKQELAQSLLRRYESLKYIRRLNEKERWEAFAYADHRTRKDSITNSPVPEIELYNGAGVKAIDNFIDGFCGNLISISQNWFTLRYESNNFEEQDDLIGANKYLGLVQKRVKSELDNSNFYTEDRLASKDAFIGGCSATFVSNDPDRNICVFKTLPPWDWWCDTNMHGVYDTFFYKKTMNAFKAYEQFGDKLPETLIKTAQLKTGYTTYYDFLMCIFPREGIRNQEGRNLFGKKKKYGCVWLLLGGGGLGSYVKDGCQVISEDGYDIFPVIIHSWDSNGDNPYGTSPVIRALRDLKRFNVEAYETIFSVRKGNHPAYNITAALKETFSDEPGARNVLPSMDQEPKPLDQVQTIEGAMALEQQQQVYLQQIFYNDMFNYLSRQEKVFTATQVNAVKSEQLSLLSAIFGNVQTQKINKLIKFVISIMSENKRLPSGASDALNKNGKLRVVLDSMLAQNLRNYSFKDSGLATLELAERCIQMQKPEWLDNINGNNLIRGIMLGNGTDSSVIVDKAEVEAIQQQRAMLQAQQMQQQAQLQQSEMVRNMGGVSNNNNSTGANQYK